MGGGGGDYHHVKKSASLCLLCVCFFCFKSNKKLGLLRKKKIGGKTMGWTPYFLPVRGTFLGIITLFLLGHIHSFGSQGCPTLLAQLCPG